MPDAGSHPIADDVTRQLEQTGIPLDENALETALKQASDQAMARTALLGEDAVELPHALRQIPLRGLHHDMIVIGHSAVGMTAPMKAQADLREHRQPSHAVGIVTVDRRAR
jgi:hypothetical protein